MLLVLAHRFDVPRTAREPDRVRAPPRVGQPLRYAQVGAIEASRRVKQEGLHSRVSTRRIASHNRECRAAPEVAAGNLVGTLLYFLWFNMGLIALTFPVRADPLVVRLDWPYLVGVTWLATLFFARGRVGRPEGLVLVVLYCVYVVLHIALS